MQTVQIKQPVVFAPINITAHVSQYCGDHRIAVVEFRNDGNGAAPKRLSRAVLVPEGVRPSLVLLMSPNQQLYTIPRGGEVSHIDITVGRLKGRHPEVDVLVAVINIESGDDSLRHVHACASFD